MEKKPRVFIILVNWNNWQDTLECIRSLANINYANHRIIVIDNGSTDDSFKRLKRSSPKVKLIRSQENLGFAGGNNVGIRYSLGNKADYVLLLNNDTVVDKDFLEPLVQFLETDPKFGIVGPLIYDYHVKDKLWWAGGKFDFWLNFHPETEMSQSETKIVTFQSGCAMLIKKEVFEKVGFLDEDYFLYYEDADFCFSAKRVGFSCAVTKKSNIWHKISMSTKGEENPANEYYYVRNKLKFGHKNCPRWRWFLFFILYSGKILLKSLHLFLERKSAYGFMGYFDFLNHRWGKFKP